VSSPGDARQPVVVLPLVLGGGALLGWIEIRP
jgi:hypothetical protein